MKHLIIDAGSSGVVAAESIRGLDEAASVTNGGLPNLAQKHGD